MMLYGLGWCLTIAVPFARIMVRILVTRRVLEWRRVSCWLIVMVCLRQYVWFVLDEWTRVRHAETVLLMDSAHKQVNRQSAIHTFKDKAEMFEFARSCYANCCFLQCTI